jgi:hypothetical protein
MATTACESFTSIQCPACGIRQATELVPSFGVACRACGHLWQPDQTRTVEQRAGTAPGPAATPVPSGLVLAILLLGGGALLKAVITPAAYNAATSDGFEAGFVLVDLVYPAVVGYLAARRSRIAYLWIAVCPVATVSLIAAGGLLVGEWATLGYALAMLSAGANVIAALGGVLIGHGRRWSARRRAAQMSG